MLRLFPACFGRASCAFAFLLSVVNVTAGVRDLAEEQMLQGRLATVEPAVRRITLIPEGETDLVELFVVEDAEVSQGERPLSLSELVIQVGQRVIVRYYVDSGRRLARSVSVTPA